MKNVYLLTIGVIMAGLPVPALAQAQPVATLSSATLAETEAPPFCWVCSTVYIPGWACSIQQCNPKEHGFFHCAAWGNSCSDNYCTTWGSGCLFLPETVGADGSVRAPQLKGLTHEAVAAVLGSVSADDPTLRRPCDEAIVVRTVDTRVAVEQRRKTGRIVI